MAFIAETKEYLAGKLRQGTTMSGDEVTTFIKSFKPLLPGCVVKVIIRADSEFFSQEAITACEEEKYRFLICVKVTDPPFVSNRWYSVRGRPGVEYNSCVFKPPTWGKAYRFVVMRILQTDTEMVFFQMVMLTYNLWRHLQAFAEAEQAATFRRHTVHMARLTVF